MGGGNSSNYSIERFIKDYCENNYDIQEVPKTNLNEKLEALHDVFFHNKNAYKDYKNKRKELDEKEGKKENYYDEEISKFEYKPNIQKYSCTVSFCIQINKIFMLKYSDLYLIILRIMEYLMFEIEFIKIFMAISSDKLSNIISSKDMKLEEGVYVSIINEANLIFLLTEAFSTKIILRDEQLNNIRKLITIPKKLNDNNFVKKIEIKKNLLKIFKNSLLLNKELWEAAKDQNSSKKKDYRDFVRSSISEFNNATIFTLATNMILNETDTSIQKDILDSLFYLCHLDFVLIDQYIRYDKEVKEITELIDLDANEDVMIGVIKFLIIFLKNSFSLENNDLEEKIYKKFDSTKNEELALLISLLFLCLSIIEEVWENIKKINIIVPTSKFIYAYIANTFRSPFKEDDPLTILRIKNISLIIDILSFLTKDKASANYCNIFHIDLYKHYCDVTIILFKIFHPSFRSDILNIMCVFSYYYDCKARILSKENEEIINIIKKRIKYLYDEMRKLNQIYQECSSSKQSISDMCSLIKGDDVKGRYEENITLFENTQRNTKNLFIGVAEDINQLISIFVNLMIGNDFSMSIRILTNDAPEPHKESFFLYLENIYKETLDEELLKEIISLQNSVKIISYQTQLEIALILVKPKGSVNAEKNSKSHDRVYEDYDEKELFKFLLNQLKENTNDYDIAHKFLYAINRFICKITKIYEFKETIRNLLYEIAGNLFGNSTSSIVNRELLRIMCSLTMFHNDTLFWLKLDSRKLHIDNSNYTDFLLKINVEVEVIDKNEKKQTDENRKQILFPPYKRIPALKNKKGAIFYDEHVIVLPKRLELTKNFTVTFHFYNPVPNTEKYHTLLQDSTGIGGLIVIDSSRRKIGSFTVDGKFIDSGFDLGNEEFNQKWLFFTFSYEKIDESTKVYFNLDTKKEKIITEEKILIPSHIQYVGNSRDYDEPFGAICDVRIHKHFFSNNEILERIKNSDNEEAEDIFSDIYFMLFEENNFMDKFLRTKDVSEETFLFSIKFLNNLLSKTKIRNKLFTYDIMMKILKFYKSKKMEIKKEISKFFQSIY